MAEEKWYIGIDVSKAGLDISVVPSGEYWQEENTPSGIASLIDRLRPILIDRIIVEATGGYEGRLVDQLVKAGMPVCRVNPARVRRFAQGMNWLAKTDKIDAKVLAKFGEKSQPRLLQMPTEAEKRLATLVKRRRQVLDMLVAEENRLELADDQIVISIKETILFLRKQLADLDDQIQKHINDDPALRKKKELLTSVPGVGKVLSSTLISQMPELGSCDRKEIAALGGLAPFNHDSGRYRGKRMIRGGRPFIRRVLYMATIVAICHNPVIKSMYERLLEAGKLKKVARVACMRKLLTILNAILKTGIAWQPIRLT